MKIGKGKVFFAHFNDRKQGQTVKEHALNTAEFCAENLDVLGLHETGRLLGCLHDLGKYTWEYCNYLKSACEIIDSTNPDYIDPVKNKGKIPHAFAGTEYVERFAKLPRLLIDLLGMPMGGHHTGLEDALTPDGECIFHEKQKKLKISATPFDEILKNADPEVLEEVQKILSSGSIGREFSRLYQKTGVMFGLKETIPQFYYGMLLRLLYSALIDADRRDAAGRPPKRKEYDWEDYLSRLENYMMSFPGRSALDELRSEISRHCRDSAKRDRGIYRLTVPTGGGKTLASLRFALNHAKQHKMSHIFFITPFLTIIEQNAEVARKSLNDKKMEIVLEHHSNVLSYDAEDNFRIRDLYEQVCENWNMPVIYTTMVQFLNALFSGDSRSARRFHSLADSVIVVDEVQSLPPHMIHIFNNAMNFLHKYCCCTIVFSSATQPPLETVKDENGSVCFSENPELYPDTLKLYEALKRVDIEYIEDGMINN